MRQKTQDILAVSFLQFDRFVAGEPDKVSSALLQAVFSGLVSTQYMPAAAALTGRACSSALAVHQCDMRRAETLHAEKFQALRPCNYLLHHRSHH